MCVCVCVRVREEKREERSLEELFSTACVLCAMASVREKQVAALRAMLGSRIEGSKHALPDFKVSPRQRKEGREGGREGGRKRQLEMRRESLCVCDGYDVCVCVCVCV